MPADTNRRRFTRREIQQVVARASAQALQEAGARPTPIHKARLLRAHLRLAALLAEQAGLSPEEFTAAAGRQYHDELDFRAELSVEDAARLRMASRGRIPEA